GDPEPDTAAQPVAAVAAAGLLSQYADRLWRLCRGLGALGSVPGGRDGGDHATVHLRPGGPGLDAVAGGNQAGTAEQPGLPRCAAGGRRLGADRAGTQSAAKAQESPPASVSNQPALGVAVRGRAAWAAAW